MAMNVEIVGLKELEDELDQLSKSAGKGVLRRSLKKAAQPMADKAMAMVPRDKGSLAASITVSTKLAKRQGKIHRKLFKDTRASVEMFVGPSYDLGKGGRHGHLVEFGTAPHLNKGKFAGTRHPGTSPQPFMRPAFDEDGDALLDRLGKLLWEEVAKAIGRAERKAAKDAAKAAEG